MKTLFEEALDYVRDNLTHPCDAEDVIDLLEEYGQDNDLPEMWWAEYYDIDDIVEQI